MRIICPLCGERDRREFTCVGSAAALGRPAEAAGPAAWDAAWDAFLHLRDNPAGASRELWYHGGGCSAWLVVDRDTASHLVAATELVAGGADAD